MRFEMYSSVEREDNSGMSFLFTVDRYEWQHRGSAVTFPAYEQTSITARSAEIVLDRARPALDSVRQKADALP